MESEKAESTPKKRSWRRAAVASSVVGGMLISGLAVLPLAVMNSSHRDQILNERLSKQGLTATSESGSGSWVTPIVISNLELRDETGRLSIVIRELRTSRTVFGLLMNGGSLGKFTLLEPTVKVELDENGKLPPGLFAKEDDEDAEQKPGFEIEVVDGEFELSVPWRPLPIVELDDLDITTSVTNKDGGRWLDVSPVQIFDHEQISESHTEQNLALIAPVLSQSTALSGEISARLNGITVQLDADPSPAIPFSGEAVFHSVEARLKKEWTTQISQMIGKTIGAEIPDRLEIAKDSSVEFSVDEEGIHHQGLAFLLPEIARDMQIQSSGTVGLDEQLNLALAVQMPQIASSNPLMAVFSKMMRMPFQLQVKGTVDEPTLVSPAGFSVVDQMSRNLSPDAQVAEPPSVQNSVLGLVGATTSDDPEEVAGGVVSGVLNIIRAAKKAKENAPPKEKPAKEKRRKKKDRKQPGI